MESGNDDNDAPGREGVKSDWTLLKQGAEARIYRSSFLGHHSIIKERFKKSYRHPKLDAKLTQKRTSQEVRTIMRCRQAGKNHCFVAGPRRRMGKYHVVLKALFNNVFTLNNLSCMALHAISVFDKV